ncbi:dr1-associated corepressor-like isoform X1 [Acipenser ruthenus]|uniref:dr1-associated corepressor-like isoform X1 n=2 Tax=Acipenser ruthenus TaxID=7906 RepID=UPI0027422A5A|nr:dr1-associated corepressor-like isoform X1 [Acipenser ruthenus]
MYSYSGFKKNKMPGRKRKYNTRFPPSRIKKIMQKDKEVGKVAAAVPVIISRALEMFLKSLLTQTSQITQSKHTRTMTQAHFMFCDSRRQCINTEKNFDFLKDLAAQLPALRPSQEQGLAKGVWTSHRWQDLGQKAKRGPTWKVGPSKKVGESQIVTSQMQDSMETQPDSDDSEPELVICLDKGESPSHISRWNTHSGRSRSSYFSSSCTHKILSK